MALILIGVLLIIAGVVLATLKTLKRGKLSQPPSAGEHGDTLEPDGRGERLSLKSDLPGVALFLVGAVLIFLGALF